MVLILPRRAQTLVVEAVDQLGPFQTMDGAMGPGAMNMDGMDQYLPSMGRATPSNLPNVAIARSDVFHVTPQAETR